jgi:hypothetical protein
MVSLQVFFDIILPAAQWPWALGAASNRNEHQEYFLKGKGGRWVGLTTLPSSWADWQEIWVIQLFRFLRACTGISLPLTSSVFVHIYVQYIYIYIQCLYIYMYSIYIYSIYTAYTVYIYNAALYTYINVCKYSVCTRSKSRCTRCVYGLATVHFVMYWDVTV